MIEGVCPFCGAGKDKWQHWKRIVPEMIEIEYSCGTIKFTDDYYQSGECKDRQIVALQAALAAAKAEISDRENRLVWWMQYSHHNPGTKQWEEAEKKLKNLGEIP